MAQHPVSEVSNAAENTTEVSLQQEVVLTPSNNLALPSFPLSAFCHRERRTGKAMRAVIQLLWESRGGRSCSQQTKLSSPQRAERGQQTSTGDHPSRATCSPWLRHRDRAMGRRRRCGLSARREAGAQQCGCGGAVRQRSTALRRGVIALLAGYLSPSGHCCAATSCICSHTAWLRRCCQPFALQSDNTLPPKTTWGDTKLPR